MMKVYLSGGMRSRWQEIVISSCPDIHFINPCNHGLKDSKEYTLWDLTGVDQCDVILAYMESDNPGGQGLCYECGYGKGKGKLVIVVDEKMDRYMAILREHNHVFQSLSDAMLFLNSLAKIWREK
jgi:nucleoside 2-deoxyribosyltransferase